MKQINSAELITLIKESANNPIGKPYLLISSCTPTVTFLIKKYGGSYYSITNAPTIGDKYSYLRPVDRDTYFWELFHPKQDLDGLRYAYDIATIARKSVFLLVLPAFINVIPESILNKCELLRVTFRDNISGKLSEFLDSTETDIWNFYHEETWLSIDKEWRIIYSESDILGFWHKEEKGYRSGYERLKRYLPNLPLKIYSPTDKLNTSAILNEIILYHTIECIISIREDPRKIIPELIRYLDINEFHCIESDE